MRPSWVEIDLAAIRSNVSAIVELVAPARVCAVVKADGYGHGDVPVAEAALGAGSSWLAVALPEEGIRLREAGVEAPILLLSEPPTSDAAAVIEWNLTPTVYRREFLQALEQTVPANEVLPIHVKLDTGMHRVGADGAEALRIARTAHRSAGFEVEGLWTHLAVADEDDEFTHVQLDLLRGFAGVLHDEGIEPPLIHAANSPGAFFFPSSRLGMVRVGIAMYGLSPAPARPLPVPLTPAMRVVSRVSRVSRHPAGTRPSYGRIRALEREATLAVAPIGYADGVARRLGEVGGEVLIGGARHPFAGSVTMDQVIIDVGDQPVEVGDEVVLLGPQGEEEITADEWAEKLGTINYEIVCDFGPRLPRVYL